MKFLLCSVLLTASPLILAWMIKKMHEKELLALRKPPNFPIECIFVTQNNKICNNHISSRIDCGPNCSYSFLKKIVRIMDNAKYCIKVCILLLTSNEVSMALIRAKKRGVDVIFITDREMKNISGTKIDKFVEAGIRVKLMGKKTSKLHHKFIIIDECDENSAKLVVGSANITLQAFTQNYEQIVFIDGHNGGQYFLEKFTNEFKLLLDS